MQETMTWPSLRQLRGRLIILLGAIAMVCGCANNDAPMHSEKIVDWTKYEVTGANEVTFTVTTGDPKCFGLRSAVKESQDSLEVAIVEGVRPNPPKECTAVGRIEEISVTTEFPARSLDIRTMPPEEVGLNNQPSWEYTTNGLHRCSSCTVRDMPT